MFNNSSTKKSPQGGAAETLLAEYFADFRLRVSGAKQRPNFEIFMPVNIGEGGRDA